MIQRNELIDTVIEGCHTASHLEALLENLFNGVERMGLFLEREVNVSPFAHSQQTPYLEVGVVYTFSVRTHRNKVHADLV